MFKLIVGQLFEFTAEHGVISLRIGSREVWWSTSQGWERS
jgi:hypothetical protein